ncbi:c-type cytochrome [Campylobacter estrildidarum]|uniref:Cytochrome C oxidase Cbb3 n=1 Tax=Campylobacter estrildidarum TaxID=2510189 RepID=A0A4U7BQ63_9BACT|nr:c-type cytochrome [Campylobacter estrildidarum]TKX30794.1 cytochrome C oxidase Cbb3 [Campylobacter estrildidarum]
MGKILIFFTSFFIALSISACGGDDELKSKKQNSVEEKVQLEQSDETTQLSDSNLPLPVDDEAEGLNGQYNTNLSIVNSLYKQKCANCHGEKGELKPKKSVTIKNLSREVLVLKLQKLKDESHNFLSTEQIENLAKYITKVK